MKLSTELKPSCIVLLLCVSVIVLFLDSVVDASKHPETTTAFPKRDIIGAWKDNKNRTVYICGCDVPNCREVFWSMTTENTTNNTTRFGYGTLNTDSGDNDDYSGWAYWLTISRETDNGTRVNYDKFHLNQRDDEFEGKLSGNYWKLKTRLYEQEPGPSICWKPARYERVPKLVGKWQRTSSTGDQVFMNMCPDMHGTYQWSIRGTEGVYRAGEFANYNLTWYGKRFSKNFTDDDDLTLLGGTAFVQSGSTILMEVNTDYYGRFIERNQWSYIGLPDLEECNMELPPAFPFPWERLSLLTYVGIGVAAAVVFYFQRRAPKK